MLSVNGIFEAGKIKLFGDVPKEKRFKVIVTFVEEIDEDTSAVREFSAQSKGFDFWIAQEEDLYQDYLDANKGKP